MLKKLKKENGQAMVEFALVLPILLLLVAGIIDFGWIFHNQLAANNASREAARYIAIHYYIEGMDKKLDPTVEGSAEKVAKNMIVNYVSTLSNINVTDITPAGDDASGGEKIKVKFTGDVVILTPFLQKILDNGDGKGLYTVTASCTMRIEK